MLIEDRVRQLRKSIPTAIAELSEEVQNPPEFANWRDKARKRENAIDAASAFKLLAASLLAAADAALQRLIPPRPVDPPIDPYNPRNRPGSRSPAPAPAATVAEPQG